MEIDRLLPQDINAEIAVLGAMMMDKEAIYKAVEYLSEDAFYRTAHRQIYNAIIDMFDKNEPVDLVTLTNKLRGKGELGNIGGAIYLTTILNSVPTAANVQYYIQIVNEKALAREVININNEINGMVYSQKEIVEVLNVSESKIFDIIQRGSKKDNFTTFLSSLAHKGFDYIEQVYEKKSSVVGIPSGYIDLDIMTLGFQPSDLIVIAGRPSMGKSALALNIAQNVVKREKMPVLFFSLEMSKDQIFMRVLCSEARVNSHKVKTGYLAEEDWARLTTAVGIITDSEKFIINDKSFLTPTELRIEARKMKAMYDIKLIIIDYLQLMTIKTKTESREQAISEISQSLKALAKELNIPIIVLSQLSRAVESRAEKIPQLSDLRGSGAIEQDADLVAFVYREEYYKPTPSNEGVAEIIIAKQRNGSTGTVKLAFIKQYARFENLSKVEV